MTYTDNGHKVRSDTIPLAMANGIDSRIYQDVCGTVGLKQNLYRRWFLERVLYRVGWWLGRFRYFKAKIDHKGSPSAKGR